MQEFPNGSAGYVRGVELLFAHLDDAAGAAAVPPLGTFRSGPARPPISLPRDWPPQPPALDGPEGLRAAQDWFRAERLKLEAYTEQQFETIRQQHYEVLTRHYQNEADIARRVQEINRELQLLATQAAAMKERARGLAEWEEALDAQTAHLARLQQEHVTAREASGAVSPAESERLAALEVLRAATSHRQLSEAAGRAKFEAVQILLQEHQATWETKQAEVLARQEQLERRCRELEKAEDALRRRIAEIDDMEDRMLRCWEEAEAPAHGDAPQPAGRRGG